MAIWKLRAAHYLNVPGTRYIRSEIDGETGEAIQHIFEVPRLLDPEDTRVHTPRGSGQILVANAAGKKANPSAWLFIGQPGPDMDPMDEEAEAISAKYRATWINPMDSLPEVDQGVAMAAAIGKALAEQLAGLAIGAKPAAAGSAEFDALQARIKELEEQLAAAPRADDGLTPETQPILTDEPELDLGPSVAEDGDLTPEELAAAGLTEQPKVLSAAEIAAMNKGGTQPAGRRR